MGRRPLLLVGFSALPIRALLFAWTTDPMILIAAQVLDGVSGTMLGVLTARIIADLTKGTGRFNMAQGFVGTMSGVGASLSTTLSSLVAGSLGRAAGFLGDTDRRSARNLHARESAHCGSRGKRGRGLQNVAAPRQISHCRALRVREHGRNLHRFSACTEGGWRPYWHNSEAQTRLTYVRYRGHSGPHMLGLRFSQFDPQAT
jgi:hypothetical protein